MFNGAMCDSPKEVGSVRRATLRQRLEGRLKDSKDQVAKIETALKLLDENPTFEKIQNAISDLGF